MEKLVGVSVYKGIVVERACCFYNTNITIPHHNIMQDEVESECQRFEAAVKSAVSEVVSLGDDKTSVSNLSEDIQRVYQMLLGDVEFHSKVKVHIEKFLSNAEWAAKAVTQDYTDLLLASESEYLSERVHEINEVGMRIIHKLMDIDEEVVEMASPGILVRSNLYPSRLLKMDKTHLRGTVLRI